MTKDRVPTEWITRERLRDWAKLLDEAHATPALLIGLSHDEQSGAMHIWVPEDTPDELVIGWLLTAVKEVGGMETMVERLLAMIGSTGEARTPGSLIIPPQRNE